MKKLLASFLVLMLVGCTSVEPDVTSKLNILAPKGATAIATLDLLNNEAYEVSLVDGTDVIQAGLVNPNGEYDIIIAPSNLGAKLASAGKSNFKMIAVITWGNLYIVGKDEAMLTKPEATIALFGDQAVPGKVFELVKGDISAIPTYYGAVNEAQAQLLANKSDLAMLAEPSASATITKDPELKILMDLQEKYKKMTNSEGYPQASIFVNADKYAKNKDAYDQAIELIKNSLDNNSNDLNALALKIDQVTPELLGVPNSKIIINAYSRLNLNFKYANTVTAELDGFLSQFDIGASSTYIVE